MRWVQSFPACGRCPTVWRLASCEDFGEDDFGNSSVPRGSLPVSCEKTVTHTDHGTRYRSFIWCIRRWIRNRGIRAGKSGERDARTKLNLRERLSGETVGTDLGRSPRFRRFNLGPLPATPVSFATHRVYTSCPLFLPLRSSCFAVVRAIYWFCEAEWWRRMALLSARL